MLPIYVISVRGAADRRQNATRQMQSLGLKFEFFDGLDGGAGRACFDRVDDDRFLLNTGKQLCEGEIGCHASHKALWRRCVERRQPIMIMEDDFRLAPQFPDAARCVGELIDEVGYVRLQAERRARSTPVMLYGPFQVERYTKMPHCAMCYALTPRIAARLLEMSRDFVAPVDVIMKRVWQIGQPMYCLTPYTVGDSTYCQDSVIGLRTRCRKPLAVRARRTLMKAGWLIRQWIFNRMQSDRPLQQHCSGQARGLASVRDRSLGNASAGAADSARD